MAQIGFKTVQLLKNQTLGIGSYGKVCKAKCDDLLCAAKLIHETLFDPTAQQLIAPEREHRLPMRRFEQECEFLSTIRHPNIVQYLGIYQDPDTGLPALLMELMDDSLTHFLESSPRPIPYHIQVNICRDITVALTFLHSNDIIHRDLSSNNVLLISNVRAKVTDFGMARLGDQNPRATQLTFTMCPGTDAYMPPEAVKDKPVYTEKIDCFSFGVIAIQIITRQFPKPEDRRKEIQINHPGLPSIIEVPVSEIERRQNHLSEIDPNHTLLPVALDCLKDRDVERPSAQQLCERVAALKEDPQYSESVRVVEVRNSEEQDERDRELRLLRQQLQDLQQVIQTQMNQFAEKDQIIAQNDQALRENGDTIAELQQQTQRLEREKSIAIEEKEGELRQKLFEIDQVERQLGQVNQQLNESERANAQLRKQITELEQLRPAAVKKDKELRSLRQQYSQQVQDLQQIVQSQTNRLAEMDQTIAKKEQCMTQNNQEKDEAIAELRQQVTTIQQSQKEKEKELQQKVVQLERQLGRVNQQLEESERVNAQFRDQRQNTELEQLIRIPNEQTASINSLTWRVGEKAIREMSHSYCAVMSDSTLYVRLTGTHQVFDYIISTSSWSQLPDSPTDSCPSVIINNLLTLVGGNPHRDALTNKLFSLIGEGSDRRWTEEFPPMPTKRFRLTAVCTGASLIVTGGVDKGGSTLQTVEVLNTETLQWSTVADLPQPLYQAPTAVCGDQIYILGKFSNVMYKCSLLTLIQSRKPFLAGIWNRGARIWQKVAAPPVTGTTCVSIHGQLLAIGGKDSDEKPTTAIHMYTPTTDSWKVISHMKAPRCDYIAAVLPNNQLMVVGGYTTGEYQTDSVEYATVECRP